MNSWTASSGECPAAKRMSGAKYEQGVVAPVVAEPALNEVPFVGVLMHRHQFDGGHPERFQVTDRGFRREAAIGASQRFGHV